MQILIATSDVTSWMLQACLWLLDRHWPEHPLVVVGGYTRPALPAGVEFFPIGDFSDYPAQRWSDGVMRFVQAMSNGVFLWHMDDFWLCQDVDDALVRRVWDLMEQEPQVDRVDLTADRLGSGQAAWAGALTYDHQGPTCRSLDLISTPPSTPYQLSFQTGLWRTASLLRFMQPGESAGEAEIRGSARMSRAGAVVLGTRQAPLKYLIAMQHGKVHIDDSGYQVPPVALLPEDRAELARLGYLTPEGVAA